MKKKQETNDNQFAITISESGLRTIITALDCYSRMGINQFSYCLEYHPVFANLDWETKKEIEDYLKNKISNQNYGIYNPEVFEFTKAFSIRKEIEKWVALRKSGGIRETMSNVYDGAISTKDANYLPVFVGEKDYIEFQIPKRIRARLSKFVQNKDYDKMWNLINKNINFDDITGEKKEIMPDLNSLKVYKPYRLRRTGAGL